MKQRNPLPALIGSRGTLGAIPIVVSAIETLLALGDAPDGSAPARA